MGSRPAFPHTQLGAAAALLLFMSTIFWKRRATRVRCFAQMALDHQQTDPSRSSLEDADHSSSDLSRIDGVPDIFLSHSGRQKPFVEQLHNALLSANQTSFFDQHSLPKGFPFPSRIKKAASDCKIGVVVLSEEFFTSKWPMLELTILVKKSEARVLPLFYKLHPQDLKSSENLSRWRRVWRKEVGSDSAREWEQVVKSLRSFNGEIFAPKTSEAAYIKQVVHHICGLLPSHAPYDVSFIQGQARLAQEIAIKFELLDPRRASMVGLHGVGGLGKTTLCKIMVNHYNSQYLGRSLLIEFPSEPGNGKESKIVEECTKALSRLANLDEHVLKRVHNFDQVVQLFKEHVSRYDVFLVMDNVWESSLEEVERLLGVGFSAKSKVLVTSRSEQVLKDLLNTRGHVNNATVAALPTPEREEAFQIFQKTFELGDLNLLVVDRNQMDRVLKKCKFSGTYHALALKALSQYVKRVCMYRDLGKMDFHLSCILEEISNAALPKLENVIRLSYTIVIEHKKHMFLDIAFWLSKLRFGEFSYGKAYEYMCVLYSRQFPKSNITTLMHELALDGLIQIEEDRDGGRSIRMHDLYLDLARREAASSSRFFPVEWAKSVEKLGDNIEWEMLERVILEGGEVGRLVIEKLQQQNCQKLQFLQVFNTNTRGGIRLDSMASLRVLILEEVDLRVDETWSATRGVDNESGGATTGSGADNEINIVEVSRDQHAPGMPSLAASSFLDLNGAVQLQILEVRQCSIGKEMAGFGALRHLQRLTVHWCKSLEKLDGLSGLIQLQVLEVTWCDSLQKLPDVTGLSCLERLEVSHNSALEEVSSLSSTLKFVKVANNNHLERIPDVSGLTCLEELNLSENAAMEEVEGEYFPSTLKHLRIGNCQSLQRLPRWDKCVHSMETLAIDGRYLRMKGISLQKLTSLRTLDIQNLDHEISQEEEQYWKGLTSLQNLWISEHRGKRIDVGRDLTGLKSLQVDNCEALEEIGDLRVLHSLESLTLSSCPSLKKVDGLASTPLKHLILIHCESLELEENRIPANIVRSAQSIFISGCGELERRCMGNYDISRTFALWAAPGWRRIRASSSSS